MKRVFQGIMAIERAALAFGLLWLTASATVAQEGLYTSGDGSLRTNLRYSEQIFALTLPA